MDSPFFTRTSFPECDRRTCLTAIPAVWALPPALAFTICSESKDVEDFGEDDKLSTFWLAIVNSALCSSVRNRLFEAIYTIQSYIQTEGREKYITAHNNNHIKNENKVAISMLVLLGFCQNNPAFHFPTN